MTMLLTVFQCGRCAATYFPGRSLCAACGKQDFVEVDGSHGVIEQCTVLRKRAGENASEATRGHHLATVRTVAGPIVIAGMEQAGEVGSIVTLFREGERLMARRTVSV